MDLLEFTRQKGPKFKKELENQLLKIRSALGRESEQTKEMLEIYMRYVRGQAGSAEMDLANRQFISFLKSIGLGVLVVLPFSPVTLPAVVKLGKKFGIDILPDSMK